MTLVNRLLLCLSCLVTAVPAFAGEPAQDLPYYRQQVETQLASGLSAGWLNPACVLVVVNQGAYLVDDQNRLQACDAKCQPLEQEGLLTHGYAVSPDGVVANYVVTEKAKAFLQPHMREPAADKLCFAKAQLDTMVSFLIDGVIEGDFTFMDATYRVDLSDVAPWAKVPAVQNAFPETTTQWTEQTSKFIRNGATLMLEAAHGSD